LEEDAAAFVLTADDFIGSYGFRGNFSLFPNSGAYIVKIIPGIDGEDRAMTIWGGGLSKAHKVVYPKEGGMVILED